VEEIKAGAVSDLFKKFLWIYFLKSIVFKIPGFGKLQQLYSNFKCLFHACVEAKRGQMFIPGK
jgi:hypothetical protein